MVDEAVSDGFDRWVMEEKILAVGPRDESILFLNFVPCDAADFEISDLLELRHARPRHRPTLAKLHRVLRSAPPFVHGCRAPCPDGASEPFRGIVPAVSRGSARNLQSR